jgi:peptidoglycan/LPS O-acetylase OafA/YrhL
VLFFVLTSSKTKRLSAFVLAALCIISFGYGFIEPSMSFNLGFFSSPSRFWEIGSGVLLYFTFARNGWFERRPLPELRAATYSGAILIAASFVVGNSEHYPVPGAAPPVLGALATIVGLHGRTPISVLSKVLKSRGALWIGLISYSLYLWHWPVFTLFRWTVGFSTLPEKLLALLVAIAMAFTSYVWVEVPHAPLAGFANRWPQFPFTSWRSYCSDGEPPGCLLSHRISL